MKETALIDNDFVQHLAEIEYIDEDHWKDLILRLFIALDCSLAFHELLYRNEVMDISNSDVVKKRIAGFVKDGHIEIKNLDIIQSDSAREEYYGIVFEEVCNDILGYIPVKDIFNDWSRGNSLGEIHSLTMCAVCGYALFLSDDSDAQRIRVFLQRKFMANSINVYNRENCLEVALENGGAFGRLEKRLIKKRF